MKLNFILLGFLSLFIFAFQGKVIAQLEWADPWAGPIGGYSYSNVKGSTQQVTFTLGNQSPSYQDIAPNTTEWTLNFPVNILSVGVANYSGTPFYEYRRTTTPTDIIVQVRAIALIPMQTSNTRPSIGTYTITIPVTGHTADIQGTITMNARTLPGFGGQGNEDATNDNSFNTIIYTQPPLPLKLTNYTVSSKDCNVKMDWSIENVVNVSHFEI